MTFSINTDSTLMKYEINKIILHRSFSFSFAKINFQIEFETFSIQKNDIIIIIFQFRAKRKQNSSGKSHCQQSLSRAFDVVARRNDIGQLRRRRFVVA